MKRIILGLRKMKFEIQITDEVALSIRSLWHIYSVIEKKKL